MCPHGIYTAHTGKYFFGKEEIIKIFEKNTNV